jgi:hypothetical protein
MRPPSKKRRPLRAPFVVTFSVSALAAAACGGKEEGPTPGGSNPPAQFPDAGPDGAATGCPATAPEPATACDLPSSVYCDYPTGPCSSGPSYYCESGTWRQIFSNPPAQVCPATLPQAGSSCSSCTTSLQCTYPALPCGGQPTEVTAMCVNESWAVSISTCNPPAPIPDAGSD